MLSAMRSSSSGFSGSCGWRPRPSASYAATVPRESSTIGWNTIVTWLSLSRSRISRVPSAKRCGSSRRVSTAVVGLRVVVAARLVDVRAAHAELEVREVHDVALDERRVLDLRPVDEAPVAAAEVAQPQVLAAPVDLRVELRDRVGRQHQLEPLPAADPERQHVDRHALQPAAFRDGLQVPAARRFLAAHAAGPFMR